MVSADTSKELQNVLPKCNPNVLPLLYACVGAEYIPHALLNIFLMLTIDVIKMTDSQLQL